MKPNFVDMTRAQLREYTLTHSEDREALYALIDRCHAENPSPRVLSLEHLEDEILEILEEKSSKK
jgi:hypothetical protein